MRENPQDLEHNNSETHQTFIQKDVFILKKPLYFNPDSFKEKLKDLRKTPHTAKLNRGKVFIFYDESNDPKNIELYTYEEKRESGQTIDATKFEKIEIAEINKIFTTAIYAKHFLQKSEKDNDRQTSKQRTKEPIDYKEFLKESEKGPFEVDLDAYIKLDEGTTPKKYVSLKLAKIPSGNHTNATCEALFGNFDNIEPNKISEVLKKLQISHDSIFDSFEENEPNKSLKNFFEISNLTYYLGQAEERLNKIIEDAKRSNEKNSNDEDKIGVGEVLTLKSTQDQETLTDQPPETEKTHQHTKTPIKIDGLQDDSQSDKDDEENGVKRFSRTSSIASNFSEEEDHKKPSSTPSITGTNHLTTHSIDHIYTKLRKDELQNYLQEFATRTIHAHADDRYMPQSFKIKPESEYAGFGLKIECDYSSNTLCIIGQNNSKNYVSRLNSKSPSCGEKFEGNIELFFKEIENFYKVSRKDKKAMDCAITCFFRNRALDNDKMTFYFENGKTQNLQSKTCLIKDENGKTEISTKPFLDADKDRIEKKDKEYLDQTFINLAPQESRDKSRQI